MKIIYSNKTNNFSDIVNILLIDNNVPDYSVIFNSVNSFTLPIVYSNHSSATELYDFLQKHFTTIHRIGIVFTSSNNSPKLFLDNKSFFDNENSDFMIKLIKEFNVVNIDFLACDTLLYSNYVDYYQELTNNTSVIVGASDNKVGNPKNGGDWIMENIKEDINGIYFTEKIEDYTYLLDVTGLFTIVLLNDGTIYGSGLNNFGQLGTGDKINRNTFTIMINNTDKTPYSVYSGSYHTIVLMTDRTIYGCGYNVNGQLGNGTNESSTTLKKMINITGKTPFSISCGSEFTIVLMTDGEIYGCGINVNGQLGNGTNDRSTTLKKMMNNTGKTPKSISCGSEFTIVLMTDGEIYGCGINTYGQLGNGTNDRSTTLKKMENNTGKTPKSISCGSEFTIVLMTDGTIYGSGDNRYGQLGNGYNNEIYTSLTKMENNTGKTPKSIYCGLFSTLVLMTDGTIYGCGYNEYGQLGTGDIINITLTEIINNTGKTPTYITSSYHTTLLMTDGTLYGIGSNSYGELGDGTNNNSSTLTAGLISLGNPITGVKSLANYNIILTITSTTNNNTNFCKGCQICTDDSTTDHVVEYKPLKTLRRSDNMSQKMKQAAFIRRTQNTSITQTDTINFRFKNL